MEKLHKRSDGYSETSDGSFAVVPLRKSAVVQGSDGPVNIFEFQPSFMGERIRVEWPIDSAVALFPGDVSMTMVRLGYARNLSSEEVEQYNEAVDFDDSNPPPVVPVVPVESPKSEDDQAEDEEKPADDQAEDEEKKKPGRPKKPMVIPGLTS